MVRGLYEIEQVGFDDQKNEWKEGVKSNYRLSMPLTKMESRENCFLALLYTLLIASRATVF